MLDLLVLIHLFLAALWIGGTFFLVLVAAPALREVEPGEMRDSLFQAIGLRFRRWGWIAFTGLLVTGLLDLYARGILRAEILFGGQLWSSAFGRALLFKLASVGLVLALSIAQELWSLRARRAGDPVARERLVRRARTSGRLLGVAFILLLWAASRLARGG